MSNDFHSTRLSLAIHPSFNAVTTDEQDTQQIQERNDALMSQMLQQSVPAAEQIKRLQIAIPVTPAAAAAPAAQSQSHQLLMTSYLSGEEQLLAQEQRRRDRNDALMSIALEEDAIEINNAAQSKFLEEILGNDELQSILLEQSGPSPDEIKRLPITIPPGPASAAAPSLATEQQTLAQEQRRRERNDAPQTIVLEKSDESKVDAGVCLNFLRTGQCRFGERCFFQHQRQSSHLPLPSTPQKPPSSLPSLQMMSVSQIWSTIQRMSATIEQQDRQHKRDVAQLKAEIVDKQKQHAIEVQNLKNQMQHNSDQFVNDLQRIQKQHQSCDYEAADTLRHQNHVAELRMRIAQESRNFDQTITMVHSDREDGIRKAESRHTSQISSLADHVQQLKEQYQRQENSNKATTAPVEDDLRTILETRNPINLPPPSVSA